MTEPKYVAKSLTTIMENPMVAAILNRESNIQPVIDETLSWWNYDLFARKPSPAYDDYGIFKGTDLDLACFMYSLVGRGAIINIPEYKSHTKTKIREDQLLKSKYNRHGELLSVGANKHFWSFNINIMDQNIVGEDRVGAYRTFSLTGKDGEWYEGWRTINFEPTLKENRFITENKMWSGSKIVFKNFIHPNRWTSFFGHHYVITKLLIDRLTDQAAFLNKEIKRLTTAGVTFPSAGDKPESHEYSYGDSVSKKFVAFEAKVYIPKTFIEGEYTSYDYTTEDLVNAYTLRKAYNKVISSLRFMTRASEYAHSFNPDRMPYWMKNVVWEKDFVEPGKRTKWDRLKLFQPAVGQQSVSILKRMYEKSAQVSAD